MMQDLKHIIWTVPLVKANIKHSLMSETAPIIFHEHVPKYLSIKIKSKE